MRAMRPVLLSLVVVWLTLAVAGASPPSNDSYPGFTIDSLPYTATGSTVEATGEPDEPDPGDVWPGPVSSLRPACVDSVTPDSGCLRSVWFSLPPGLDAGNTPLTVETCGSDFDTVLAGYPTYGSLAPPLGSLQFPVWSDDDGHSACPDESFGTSQIGIYTSPADGPWMRLVINGYEADAGDYVLRIYAGPNTHLSINSGDSDDGYLNPLLVLISSTSGPATFECSLDGSAFAPCASVLGPPVTADANNAYFNVNVPLGPHTLAARARDADGNLDPYPAVLSWATLAPPGPPPSLPTPPSAFPPLPPLPPPTALPPQRDQSAPRVSGLTISPRSFRPARRAGSIAAAVGAKVSYSLSEAGLTTFTVKRSTPGRRVGKRCVAPSRGNGSARRCTRFLKLRGSFTHRARSGGNSFRFTGRLAGKKLPPGNYRLVARAKDLAGNLSASVEAPFGIRR